MTYRSWFIKLECADKWQVEKWINSLKLIINNPADYEEDKGDGLFQDHSKKEDKYLGLNVYQKITVKSCFKDYAVLCEEFEHKAMLQIYLKSVKYLAG